MTVLMKRNRDNETLALANCLMLLSRVGDQSTVTAGGRVFTCKTCDREFGSFQALGGHRASHKKLKLVTGDLDNRSPPTKSIRAHECAICGQEFAIGQALGGHMRRHRAALEERKEVAPVLKKSSSGSKRVLSLDLNLTPFENDVKTGKESSNLPWWLNLGLVN